MRKELFLLAFSIFCGLAGYFLFQFLFPPDPKVYVINHVKETIFTSYTTFNYKIENGCIRFIDYTRKDCVAVCGNYTIEEKSK